MAEYLMMILEDEGAREGQSAKAMAELIEARSEHADRLRRAGRLRDAGTLKPSKEGKRVRRREGKLEVRDGPFAEEGLTLGGYCWVSADNLEEAAALAVEHPQVPTDKIDVRPLMKGSVPVEKDARPGKVFACAVLGNTPTEEAWTQGMDRIDAETRERFPEELFLGGVRLQPPSHGRRVVARGERRAVMDGPFLESKEVIGGVFFLRMASIEEAVRWASESGFVTHGTLEIRELWRT